MGFVSFGNFQFSDCPGTEEGSLEDSGGACGYSVGGYNHSTLCWSLDLINILLGSLILAWEAYFFSEVCQELY
ncbi:glycosyltransferase, MGT family [Methanothermobacter sp. MT-2]|nr:glycosyltransferase, MGT family [Methanothermobacter sp. MT-2]